MRYIVGMWFELLISFKRGKIQKILLLIYLLITTGCVQTESNRGVSIISKHTQQRNIASKAQNSFGDYTYLNRLDTSKYDIELNSKIQEEQNKTTKYQQNIDAKTLSYETKILYETNYQVRELLDYAKLTKNPYPYIKKAFDIHTKMQQGLFSILDNEQKKSYIQKHRKYIDRLLNATTTKQDIQSTFNRWLNYKRTLFDDENGFYDIRFFDKYMRAKKSIINRKKRELARATNSHKIDELKSDIKEFEKSLSIDKYRYIPQLIINYQDISMILKANELYIDFAKVGKYYYIFKLDNKQRITLTKINSIEVDKVIKNIRGEINKIINPQKYPFSFPDISLAKKQYKKLYSLIIDRLDIKEKSLIISPDGLLNFIPFEAFYDGDKYLIEKVNIRYIPSGKELVKLYKNKNSSNNNIFVFANPNFETIEKKTKKIRGNIVDILTPTFTALEGSKKEARVIKTLFPNAKIFGQDRANETNLLGISSPKILHISTHGFFIKSEKILNPLLKSGIVLSGANKSIKERRSEGIITALELSGLKLRNTDLVILSACETGVGEIEEAEGVAGINKAFIQAGTKQIIMSLWSVNDKFTAQMMDRFYRGIKRGDRYSQALKEAKIWMIKNKNSHPFYWAGFVGSGRDR